MALSDHNKNRLRRVIRTSMITLAVFLLVIALVIPIANNAIALSEEKQLKDIPLPAGAKLISSASAAGDLTTVSNRMEYCGAILIQSDLSEEEVEAHYGQYRQQIFDCIVEGAPDARELLSTLELESVEPAFAADAVQDDWYLVYSWGQPPDWLYDILNMDSRA